MGLTIDTDFNMYLKHGDAVIFTIYTTGIIQAERFDQVTFMIKAGIADDDIDAIVTKVIAVAVDGEIDIYLTTTEVEAIAAGKYFWSAKQTQGSDKFTIIPDAGRACYPAFIIEGVMINA